MLREELQLRRMVLIDMIFELHYLTYQDGLMPSEGALNKASAQGLLLVFRYSGTNIAVYLLGQSDRRISIWQHGEAAGELPATLGCTLGCRILLDWYHWCIMDQSKK